MMSGPGAILCTKMVQPISEMTKMSKYAYVRCTQNVDGEREKYDKNINKFPFEKEWTQ